MNLLFFASDSYYSQLITTLFSVFKNNPHSECSLFIHGLQLAATRDKLSRFVKKQKADASLSFLPGWPEHYQKDLSADGCFNVFFHKFIFFTLPPNVDRVLYLDCDLIVNGSLEDFYSQPFDGHSLIATKDLMLDYGPIVMPNGVANDSYFNAGVLLLNLTKIRSLYSVDTIAEYFHSYQNRLRYDDQDILNMLFFGDTKLMADRSYNYCVRHKDQSSHPEIKSAKIIHYYYQDNKPWKFSYINRNGFGVYWKYARLTFGTRKYLIHRFVYSIKVFRYYYLGLIHGRIHRALHR